MQTPAAPSAAPLPPGPEAQRDLLQAAALRRRQLINGLLHGSSRNWRDHRPFWPGLLLGLGMVAVIVAGMAVKQAFDVQQAHQARETRQQQLQQNRDANPIAPTGSAPASPSPDGDVPPSQTPGTGPGSAPPNTPLNTPEYLPPSGATPSDLPGG